MKKNTKSARQHIVTNFMKKNILLFVVLAFFLIGVFLRSFLLWDNLFFGPEQGIDLQVVKSIVTEKDPVLIGAKTDISGVFHGPIYYYAAALPFFISKGDPFFIAFFLLCIHATAIIFIYFLGKKLGNVRIGLIASILLTVSFGVILYSRWLSTHPLVIPLSVLFFLGVVYFLQGRKKWLFLAGASFGLVGQAEFLNFLFFGAMLFVIIILYYKKFLHAGWKFLTLNVIILLLFSVGNYVLFDIRHDFIMSKSLLGLTRGGGYYIPILGSLDQTFSIMGLSLKSIIFPYNAFMAGMLFVLGLLSVKQFKSKDAIRILFIWIFVPVFLLIILRHAVMEQFFVYMIPGVIIVIAFLVDKIISFNKKFGLLFLGILIICHLSYYIQEIPKDGQMFFKSTQPHLFIKDKIAVIDETYKRAGSTPFSFQAYTIPYWSQQAWEYLYWEHGGKTYGTQPVIQDGKILFVIIQDDPSTQGFQDAWLKSTVAKWGEEVDEFRIGTFRVKELHIP